MGSIAVFGSCISVDVWHLKRRMENTLPVGMNSVISAVHPPRLNVDFDQLRFPSSYHLTCAKRDNWGGSLDLIRQRRPSVLVIDVLWERYDLLAVNGGYLLLTDEVLLSGLLDHPEMATARRISRWSDEADSLWRASLKVFFDQIRDASPKAKIILHRPAYATVERQPSGLVTPRSDPTLYVYGEPVPLPKLQALFDRLSDDIEASAPGCVSVSVDRQFLVADPNHIWGPLAFHFFADYYDDFTRKVHEAGVDLGLDYAPISPCVASAS